jgi:hypothetical protein
MSAIVDLRRMKRFIALPVETRCVLSPEKLKDSALSATAEYLENQAYGADLGG